VIINRLLEQRGISYQTIFESGDDIAFGTDAGTNITQDTVFKINAIFSATSLIADTISTLPLDVFIRRDGARFPFRPRPDWVTNPSIDLPREAFYNQIIMSMLLDGNAFIRVFRGRQNQIVNLMVLNPMTVIVNKGAAGRLTFNVEGEARPLTTEEILFIPDVMKPGSSRGISRVDALKQDFGLALALTRYASMFFGNGTSLNGVIEFPGNLTEEQAKGLQTSFDSSHKGWRKAHRTGVLTGGAQFKPTQIDPEKATLVESRNQSIGDVARAFKIPPHLLGLEIGMSYASVEQTNLAWVTHCLRPTAAKIESAMSTLMATTPGGAEAFLRFNMDGLLRADIQSRTAAYSTMIQAGAMSINEVRALEDLRPNTDPAADAPRVPLANVNIEDSHVKAQAERVRMAQALVYSGYDPADVLQALNLPAMGHTGLPSSQLQPISQIDPEDPESVYQVQ